MNTSPEWVAEPPGWRLGVMQLKAMLWRQWLLKRRSPVSTIVEVLSPIVLISVLVIAYLEVEPDVMPAKIYVNETAQALRSFMEPFAETWHQPSSSNCSDLLNRVMVAEQARDAGWEGDTWQPSAEDMAAVNSCMGTLDGARASNWTDGQSALAGAAVKLLQAFIDSNGPIPIPTLDEFILLHKALQAAVQAQPEMLGLLQGARRSFGWNVLGNLVDMGKLAFAPATPEVLRLAKHLDKKHEFFGESFYGVFRSETEAIDFVGSSAERLWALVVFDSGPDDQGADYTIRMNFTTVPRTWIPVNKWRHSVPIHYKEYYTSGFLSLQGAIDSYVLGTASSLETSLQTGMENVSIADSGVIIQRPSFWTEWGTVFPTAEYIHNEFYDGVGPMLGLLMSLSLVYPLSMLVRGIVEEREKRLKETMCIMGLQGWVLHAAWMITYAIMLLIISAAVTVVCCASFLRSSDPSLLLVLLLFFAASELAFGLLIASVFSNAKTAGIVAPLAHFACLMPRYIFFRSEAPQAIAGKVAVSLLSPSAFTFAADLIGQYEGSGVGLQWSDMWSDPLPLGAILFMLAIDAKIYAGLAWYLEKVVPGPYGPQLPWHFPLSRSFWLSGDVTEGPVVMPILKRLLYRLPWRRTSPQQQAYEQVGTADIEEGVSNNSHIHGAGMALANGGASEEPVGLGPASQALAQMQNLRKVYGRHVAVHNMTLPLRVDEMTALLGHNGAGKTTAVGMLTGLLRPTSGSCSVMGHDVHRAAAHARQHIGYCPQANVLFGSLTVWEHLLLFCAIKGLSSGAFGPAASAASHDIMQAVGLQNQQHVRADALSGGMKRRLQVALALLGGSRVILLDEPTSGVDPASRRALWTVLAKYKKGRAMLLTTHFMDEADLLSDSIAIMAEGRLKCWGTSLSLKQRYSNGYTLTLNMSLESGKPADRQGITDLVCTTVTGASLLRTSGAETVYQLPMESSSNFADLLEALEEQSSALGLTHYAVSMPTLEEVFLACTAEPPQTEEPALQTEQEADMQGTAAGLVSKEQLVSPDGTCVIQMSPLNGAAKPSREGQQEEAVSSSTDSQDNSPVSQHAGNHSESTRHVDTELAAASKSHELVDSSAGALAKPGAELSSIEMCTPDEQQQHSAAQQPALSISRDDSAQMLWSASEEASHGPGHAKLLVLSERQHRHAAPESVPSSRSSHQEASAPSHELFTGKPSGRPPDEDSVLVDLPLDETHFPKRVCRVRWHVALKEMLRKRALVAGRDMKGMVFSLLLPLVAICLVLAILKININPTSPSIVLNFEDLLQQDPVIIASPPEYLDACLVDSEVVSGAAACPGGLLFRSVNSTSSYQLSEQLLAEKAAGAAPEYGALVFNDSIITDIAQPFTALNTSLADIDAASLLALLPLGLPLNPRAAAGSALAGLSRPESRVISDAVRRFRQHPGMMIMHNASSYHALPALVSGLHQTVGALSSSETGPTFTVKSHPLPLSSEESVQLDSLLMVLAALFVVVPFCYLSGSFTINPVTEAASQARHLQLLSGCPSFIYWAGFYIWDVMTYLVVVVLSLLVFAAYNDRATTGSLEQLCGSFLLLLLYGAAVIPLGYAYSFGFTSPSAAQVSVAALSFVLGFVAVTGSYIMQLIPKTQALQRVLVHFFRVQPPFLLGEGLIELTRFNFEKELAVARGAPTSNTAASATDAAAGTASGGEMSLSYGSVFEWRTLGRSLTYLVLEAAFFFALTLYIDARVRKGGVNILPASLHELYARAHQVCLKALHKLRGKRTPRGEYEAVDQQHATVQMSDMEGMSILHASGSKQQEHEELQGAGKETHEDVDVSAERRRIEEGGADHDSLCLKKLHKAYETKVAVNDLCLGVHQGERFGLLGPNGAGKTTILGMLTGRTQPTSGDALVDGQSVLSSSAQARAELGFCPQQDPLLDLLTGREHLALYARLKGVPEECIRGEIATVLQQTALPLEMADRPAGQYSGGSKRKLALGIALVGGSSTILLDEPSSGMDPGARRAMWNFIIDATQALPGQEGSQSTQRSVVLTTHSMEECEALCTRVGILDQGRLQCLGSTSHLKLRFGGGYLLEVHAPDDEALQARLAAFIARELGGQEDEERHLGYSKYRLPAERQNMAKVFRLMEDARKALGVQAYGVALPTLEQVFLRVVGHKLQN